MPWLPEKNGDFYLRNLKKIYRKSDVDLTYLQEEEWAIKAAGVMDPMDSIYFPSLQKLGFTHLLLIKELSQHSENVYSYYTPAEVKWNELVRGYKPTWNELGNQSELLIQLVPLSDLTATHTIVAKTTVSHLTIRNRNKGETYVNPTSVESARFKAMMKAIRRMQRKCSGR